MNRYRKAAVYGLIILALVSSSLGLTDSELSQLQWTEGVSARLQIREAITYKGYTVAAIAFPAPVESQKYKAEPEEPVEGFVGLNISKNGVFISSVVLGLGESYILPDGELKVTAKELPAKNAKEWIFESYAPWAVVELNPRGIPRLTVSVQTDKDKYVSSYATDIVATVKVENTGTADAVNVDVVVSAELPVKKGSLRYHYGRIKTGESITETITFPSPMLVEQKTYSISANASGFDVLGKPYTSESTKKITISAELPASLTIRKSAVDKMYLKDYTIVSLSLKNTGRFDLNVNITDSLPPGFKLLGNQSLNWMVFIPANGEWDYRYTVRPVEANKEGVTLPAAVAEFTFKNEVYSVRSNQPKIVVYGPKIVLKKQTDVTEVNPGDIVTVTITAENTESTPTRVLIMDTLPSGVTLISGGTTLEEFLEATRKVSFSYTIRIDSTQPVTLPPATAEYFELGTKGRRITTQSQEVEIGIKSLKKTPLPTPALTTPAPTITTPAPTITTPAPLTPVPTPPVITIPTPIPTAPPTPVIKPIPSELLREIDNYFLNNILGCNEANISVLTMKACNFFREITVEPQVNVSIRKVAAESMLLKDFTSISLVIMNNGTSDLKNVVITDSLPSGFKLLGNQSLQWVVDVPANEMWEYRYLVRPQEPSKEGIILPAASAKFTVMKGVITIKSNRPKIVVQGPKVILTKRVNVSEVKPGDNIIVNVIAENTGTVSTRVIIFDTLPSNVIIVSGNTTYEATLEADMKVSFSYTIRIDAVQPVKLPPATASYYEYESKGRKIGTKSQELEIQIKSPTKINETQALTETPGKRISESEFLQWGYILIALMLIGFVLYKLWNYRKAIKVTEIVKEEHEEAPVPENADDWYNKGFALYELGKYEEAAKAYDKAKEIIQKVHR